MKVKGSKKETRKQIVFSNGFTESEAHPPPGPWQTGLAHKAGETRD